MSITGSAHSLEGKKVIKVIKIIINQFYYIFSTDFDAEQEQSQKLTIHSIFNLRTQSIIMELKNTEEFLHMNNFFPKFA